MLRHAKCLTVVMLVPGFMAACATPRFATFPEAVRSCRQIQPSRTVPRAGLSPAHPLMAACLERHGWSADGHAVAPTRQTLVR